MQNERNYIILFLAAVFISSVSQVMLKKSAKRMYKSRIQEYMNPSVIIAYILFLGSTLLTVTAYKYIPLSMGPILEATGYIWVAAMGAMFLKEKINRKKVLGLLMIVSGTIAFNIK